jgi:hypothetical protein
MHKERVTELIMQGWEIGDDYPFAGVTILYRKVSPDFAQSVTVLKTGKIKQGEHPPK